MLANCKPLNKINYDDNIINDLSDLCIKQGKI